MKSWQLSRRAFLGGSGTLVALPLLEAMWPAVARAQAVAPRRLLFWYVPCGIHMPGWTPSATGSNFPLSPILQPLANVRNQVTVISGLDNYAATAQGDGPGDHARGTGSFITGAHLAKTDGADIRNGISVDQAAAQRIGDQTRFRSLELGIDGGSSTGDCDSGYSCAYARNISWAGPSTPVAKETEPRLAFDRLFAGLDPQQTAEQLARRRLYKQSILDYVRGDANRLSSRLGSRDRQKLDEYLTGIRGIEERLQREASEQPATCGVPGTPTSTSDYPTRIDQMIDIMVSAFQCDLTRIITFMMANGGSNRSFPNLGISSGHHDLSHHDGDATKQAALQVIDTWEVSMLAKLLERMQAIVEPDGRTMLENSLVFFSSEIEDGNSHSHLRLPVLLAGTGGGVVRPNRHIMLQPSKPLANLFISMLGSVGAAVSNFGDEGTSSLTELA